MDHTCLVVPVKPGKEEALRDFYREIESAKKDDYDRSEQRLGIGKEVAWSAKTDSGNFNSSDSGQFQDRGGSSSATKTVDGDRTTIVATSTRGGASHPRCAAHGSDWPRRDCRHRRRVVAATPRDQLARGRVGSRTAARVCDLRAARPLRPTAVRTSPEKL